MRYLLAIGGTVLGAAAVFGLVAVLPSHNARPGPGPSVAVAQDTTDAGAPQADTEGEGSLRVCNQTANPVSIALGYRAERGWQSEGWWIAGPGECKSVYSGDLESRRYYYLFAADDIGGGSWDGNVYMCTRDETFTIFGVEDCLARGYELTGFFEIDTNNRSDWTLQLTEGQRATGAGADDEDTFVDEPDLPSD